VTQSSPDSGRARTALIVLTAIWGSTFVVLQSGVTLLSPFVLISLRFLVAGVAMAIFRPVSFFESRKLILVSLPLSLSMLAGFALQTYGLETTTPARSAFLTSLSVVLVPVLDFFDTKRLPRWRLAAAALTAGTGIYVLFRPIGVEWRRGDTLTVISALVFAFYITELGRRSREHKASSLVMAQCLTISILGGALALATHPRFAADWRAFAVLGYLGVVCTAVTFLLMTWAQARVSNIEAAVIFTLEPVIAAIFSVLLGREAFQTKLWGGGALVVAAMILASTDPSEPHPVAPVEGID